jgi:ABC-2 type transport system permease protein
MRALRWFGFKQALRGAIIVGATAGFMLALQGVAYDKSYTTNAERSKFAASLTSVPSLGLIYGSPIDLNIGTSGYMVYRVVGFMGVVTGIWGLATTTRLLRGAEEDGRWEVIRTSAVSPRRATTDVMTGFVLAWVVSGILGTVITIGATSSAGIDLSLASAAIINLLIFLPGLLFATVGTLTSQLALTRQRALAYGLVPLIFLFLLRGLANTHPTSLHALLDYTPFGWALLVNPLLAMHSQWLILFGVFSCLFLLLGVWLAQRDLGSSVIGQSTTALPRYYLLKSGWQLALRQNMWSFLGWIAGALTLIGLIAGLTSVAIGATADSANLSHSIHALASNNPDLKIAFLGAGMVFLVMVLLVMAITIISSIRRDELKQYLDSILVAPQARTHWLMSRLALGYTVLLITSVLCAGTLYSIATSQHITLNFGKVLATAICTLGSVGFILGVGTLLYALKPRAVIVALYVIVGWSFLVTLLASATKLNTIVLHSSLFTYTSFNLASWPNWSTFIYFTVLGILCAVAGMVAFKRRDIIAE